MRHQITAIARWDLRRQFRNRLFWGTTIIVAAVTLPNIWDAALMDPSTLLNDSLTTEQTVFKSIEFLPTILRPYLVVFAAIVGYDAVVGERDAGTIRLVLTNPVKRRDLLLGKLCSRAVGVVIVLSLLLILSGGIILFRNGRLPMAAFLFMYAWLLFVTLSWTVAVVGISAGSASRYRALAFTLILYAVFTPAVNVWSSVVEPVFALLISGTTELPLADRSVTSPLWYEYVQRLNPLFSTQSTASWLLSLVSPVEYPGPIGPHIFSAFPLLALPIVPLSLGWRRLRRSDLV